MAGRVVLPRITIKWGYMRLTLSKFLFFQNAVLALAMGFSVFAQASNDALLNVPLLRVQAVAWLEQQAMTAYPGVNVEASVGNIDTRLRLPACTDPRFFLPGNAQLWGRGSLGVRCEAPNKWSIYMTYQSRLIGPALVATRPIAAREQAQSGDIELRQIEYTQSPDLYPREMPANARLNRPVAAGQPIVIGWFSLPTVIQSGRKVRLQSRTPTFTVSQEGTALNTAAPGELVRVKTPGGRIVQGTANQDGTVEVRP